MRSKFSTAFAVLVAAIALGAVAAASASAAECPGTGEGVELCSGGHVLEGTFEFVGKHKTGTTAQFKIEAIMSLECTNTTSKGKLVATPGKVEVTGQSMEWTPCPFIGHAGCKVNPLKFGSGTGGLHGAWTNKGEFDEVALSSTGKAPFGEISITGCEQELEGKITGVQKCAFPSGIASEATSHVETCEPHGSELKYGTKIFELRNTEEISLTSGKAFSLQKG
jgi:hypothetical protein